MQGTADGPFTDWIARNREWYHGDGCITYCGPDGTPLASQRLENFRDGLEDLWYAKLLEQKLREVESSKLTVENVGGDNQPSNRQTVKPSNRASWARRAQKALAVPGEVVRSLTDYTVDSTVVNRWRDEMADLIEL